MSEKLSPVVTRAIELLRAAADDPTMATSFMLATATLTDWIERTDQPFPTTDNNIRQMLLGAAAALEAEYNAA